MVRPTRIVNGASTSKAPPGIVIKERVDLDDPVDEEQADQWELDSATPTEKEEGVEWKYVQVLERGERRNQPKVQCIFCDKVFHGGATRIRAHILGDKPAIGVASCPRMIAALNTPIPDPDDDDKRDAYSLLKAIQSQKDDIAFARMKKRKQIQLGQALDSKQVAAANGQRTMRQATVAAQFRHDNKEQLDSLWATFFYACGVPFRVTEDPTFLEAVTATAKFGMAYATPTRYRLSSSLLDKACAGIEFEIQVIKAYFLQFYLSLMLATPEQMKNKYNMHGV